MPSSTMITGRPASCGGGRPPRSALSFRSTSFSATAYALCQLIVGEAGIAHDVVVAHSHPRPADGAERELGMPGNAYLAHDECVELDIKGARHLRGDHHPAARQAEHDGVGLHTALAQHVGEPSTGLPAVRPQWRSIHR